MKELKIIEANEQAILGLLDDDMFYGELDREVLLEAWVEQSHLMAPVDRLVYAALDRALSLTIPAGTRISNGTMK